VVLATSTLSYGHHVGRRLPIRPITVTLAVVLSAIALPVQPVGAQDAEPCEPRRDLPTAGDPPADRTTFLLTTTRAELGPVITELELRLTRFGPSDGAVGVDINSFDLSAGAGEHYVAVDDWIRWEDGEVGEKTFAIEIIDHDPDEPERVFGVAMNGVDPPSPGGQAIFEYDDQINLYAPPATR